MRPGPRSRAFPQQASCSRSAHPERSHPKDSRSSRMRSRNARRPSASRCPSRPSSTQTKRTFSGPSPRPPPQAPSRPSRSTGKALHLAAALPEDPVALAEAARRLEGLLERGLAERIVVDGTSDGLAGGLTPENARTAAAAGAAGLDANSGVESAPGLKDPRLLALFAGAVRGCPRRRPKNRTH